MTKFGPGAQRLCTCQLVTSFDLLQINLDCAFSLRQKSSNKNARRQTGSTQVGLEVWTQPRPQSCYSNRIIYSDAQNDNTKQTQQGKKNANVLCNSVINAKSHENCNDTPQYCAPFHITNGENIVYDAWHVLREMASASPKGPTKEGDERSTFLLGYLEK